MNLKIKNISLASPLLLFVPVLALAAEDVAVTTPDPMSGHYLLQLIVGLLVVVLTIIVLAWFAKRVNRLQSSTGGLLTVIGGISMGAREKIVLLQVGDNQLLIGVSPGRINTLHVLDAPLQKTDSVMGASESFAEKLKAVLPVGER